MQPDKILITNLRVHAILGINPEERIRKQDILINVVISTDITRAAVTGDLSYSISYSAVARRIVQRVEAGEDYLAETLAHDLAKLIISEFNADSVMVRVEKPTAVAGAEAVGVEIVRSAADFAPAPATMQ